MSKIYGHTVCLSTRTSKNYFPTYFEASVVDITIDDTTLEVALWDPLVGGAEDYERMRPLSYPGSNVILICFPIDRLNPLENVEQKWLPEILHFCSNPSVPYLLVGCKKDLRLDQGLEESLKRRGEGFVTMENAERVASKIGAATYLECSAITGEGVMQVFERAARLCRYLPKRRTDYMKCLIL
jgi:Ras family protein A